MTYREFLESKIKLDSACGFDVDPSEINPALKPHTAEMVRWALHGGRRALFAAFGLHKTAAQLEIMRLIGVHRPCIRLIVLPLGVRQEFFRDATERFTGDHAVTLKFIRRAEELDGERTIYLTNYESVREGVLDIAKVKPGAVSLEEAAILRGFGGTKTFREMMALFAGDDRRDGTRVVSEGARYRFVATATPSPNEHIEILSYAAFLGIMDVGQAKTRFFKRNSEKADKLTLHPHKEREFWPWVASWALFVQRPSDLGFSDDGYVLPPLDIRWHEIPTDHTTAGTEKDGQARMFRNAALGVQDAAKEKRDSLAARVALTVDLVLHGRETARVSEGVQGAEPGDAAGQAAGTRQTVLPGEQDEGQSRERGLAGGESGEGEGSCAGAASAGRREAPRAKPSALHRKPGKGPGTDPHQEAGAVRPDPGAVQDAHGGAGPGVPDLHAAARIPCGAIGGSLASDRDGAGHLVPPLQCRDRPVGGQHRQPGARAGLPEHPQAARCPQVVVWCDLNDEQRAIEAALDAAGVTYSSLYGSQSVDERERLLAEWREARTEVFLSKASMYGAGVNLQQAHRMIFAGVNFKFHEVIQGVHRIHRYLQTKPCTVDFIFTEAEREVRQSLERKWQQHVAMVDEMARIIREFGLSNASMAHALHRTIGVERVEVTGSSFSLVNNDCVEETRSMPSDSVGLILTSVPFANQYEYSPSYNDFGHTDDNAQFFAQMDFLTPELLRVLQPGRVCAVHIKDRITPGGINGFGFQTVSRISDACADHFEKHGFAFLARKTIVTDVVRENNQTYRLGWSEQCKDGSRMGAGLPEYLLLFRKAPTDRSNGYADVPVVKEMPRCLGKDGEEIPYDRRRPPIPGTGYSRTRWQFDAHGFMRSSGDRFLTPADLEGLEHDQIFRLFREYSLSTVYDFENDVALGEALDAKGLLPPTFMLLQPQSWHPDVWTDVTRMRTLNASQSTKGKEMHLCPLQFDIVDRVVRQFTNEGDVVFDPFSGLGTVPCRAVKLGRRGLGVELNATYFRDAVAYLQAAEAERATPSLFDALGLTTREDAA